MYNGGKYTRGLVDSRTRALEKAENNICCALKIAGDEAKRQLKDQGRSKAQMVYATGKKGIMGAFWEPARVQETEGSRGKELKELVNKACTDFENTEFYTADEKEKARQSAGNAAKLPKAIERIIDEGNDATSTN